MGTGERSRGGSRGEGAGGRRMQGAAGGTFGRVRWLVLAALPASAEGGMTWNDTAPAGGRAPGWWFTPG